MLRAGPDDSRSRRVGCCGRKIGSKSVLPRSSGSISSWLEYLFFEDINQVPVQVRFREHFPAMQQSRSGNGMAKTSPGFTFRVLMCSDLIPTTVGAGSSQAGPPEALLAGWPHRPCPATESESPNAARPASPGRAENPGSSCVVVDILTSLRSVREFHASISAASRVPSTSPRPCQNIVRNSTEFRYGEPSA